VVVEIHVELRQWNKVGKLHEEHKSGDQAYLKLPSWLHPLTLAY
jgi:hypothetical protein